MKTTLSAVVAPGLVLADRYRLVRIIGRGGSSVVWVADHVVTGKQVALKVLTRRGDEGAMRFLREARITSRLDHPNIVDVHDVFQLEDSDELVMVMDLLEGVSLAAHLRASSPPGPLSLAETARNVVAVASALEAAHGLGVVHRDLKPDNVFLTTDGALRVLDFGVAKWARPAGEAMLTPSLTETGAIVGTPHYMAPEQVFGEPDVDGRADVWSLGVIAYECLAGCRPVEGDNFGQVFKAIAVGDIVPLRERAPRVPRAICMVVDRMLARSRDARPSLAEVRATFDDRHGSLTTGDRPKSRIGRAAKVQTPWIVVALVLVGAAAAFAYLDRSAPRAVVAPHIANEVVSVAAPAPSVVPTPAPIDSVPVTTAISAPPPIASSPRPAPPSMPRPLPGRVHGAAPY
jgi:serine/threonine protein kinase